MGDECDETIKKLEHLLDTEESIDLVEKEKLEATNEEVSRAILSMADRQGKAPKKLLKELQKNQAFGRIQHNIPQISRFTYNISIGLGGFCTAILGFHSNITCR